MEDRRPFTPKGEPSITTIKGVTVPTRSHVRSSHDLPSRDMITEATPAPLRRQRPQLIAGTAAFIVAFFEIVRRRRTQPIPEMAFVAAVPFDSVQGERFNDDDWSEWAAGLEPAARRSIEATLAYAREHGDDPHSC